jgi:hypothetical protein
MRNLILFSVAFGIALSEADVQELGYDVTEIDFRSYFSISDEIVADFETFKGEKKAKDFKVSDLKYYMNGEEQKAFATFLEAEKEGKKPLAEKKEKTPAAPKVVDNKAEEAKQKKEAAKKEALEQKEAAKKQAAEKKEADKKAKEEAKALAKKAKEEAKAIGKPKKERTLSRSQEIFILQGEGKTVKEIHELNPEWSLNHIKNAHYSASKDAELITKALDLKAEIESTKENAS